MRLVRITAVETTILRLPEVRPNGDGLQDILLIEIHTDEGITGIGEAHTMPLALKAVIEAPVSQYAVQGLAGLLIGEDPGDIEGLWRRMWRHCGSVLGGRGLVVHGMSGIDLALWDIAGKVAGRSLAQLLGTVHWPKVDVYASDLFLGDSDDVLARAADLVERGHRSIKLGWGKLEMSSSDELSLLTRLRRVLGPDIGLMLDVGTPLSLMEAVDLCEAAADINVRFVEEPLEATDLDQYAKLVDLSPVPLAAGERETGLTGFTDLIRRGRLPIVQPDLARCGGITVARAIAQRAAEEGVWVVPHCWSSDILVSATAQFLATLTQPALLEFNVMDQPLRTSLSATPLRAHDGQLEVPSGPGLGIEIDPETRERLSRSTA